MIVIWFSILQFLLVLTNFHSNLQVDIFNISNNFTVELFKISLVNELIYSPKYMIFRF